MESKIKFFDYSIPIYTKPKKVKGLAKKSKKIRNKRSYVFRKKKFREENDSSP